MALSRRVARFNRVFANHLAGPLFTRFAGFATVHHRGRRSHRPYSTPVKFFRDGDLYVITLPYGPGTDWVRNVLADGGCELTTRGARIALIAPRVVADDATRGVPRAARRAMSLIGAHEVLVLAPSATGRPGPTELTEGGAADVSGANTVPTE